MAELHVVEEERPGILKEIDDGAMNLIFQAIQQDIYSFPMRSFIRESISNGLDAIIERNIHKAIQEGDPVEKYFLQRTDDKLLKDSSYNSKYYVDKYLSSSDVVEVKYTEGYPRDLVSIKDNGVGLGGSRLKGYFKLGYSSKRNMKDVIGKFGSGAKAGLATGVEYFVVHTVYNGYKTSFMVYNNDYENITPKQDDSFIDTWTIKMANGSTSEREIYWNPSVEKNSVQVELEVKKHNKNLCIESVKNQFQYFNGKVKLIEVDQYGDTVIDTLNATPLYESDNLLIPKYSTYNNPHILVDGISYGIISWEELELDKRQGKIAIKVAATDVDITQSRESLKWTEKTKNTILKAITRAKSEAEDYIASLLDIKNPENIFEINNLYGSLARGNDETVGSVFSTFLVMHSITPKVKVNITPTRLIDGYLAAPFFDFIFSTCNIRRLSLYNSVSTLKINSTKVDTFRELRNTKIIYAESSSVGPKLVSHLLTKYGVNSLIYVRPIPNIEEPLFRYGKNEFTKEELKSYTSNLFKKYADLFVDTYDVKYDEKESDLNKELDLNTGEAKIALAALRKANKEVLCTKYKNNITKGMDYNHTYWDSVIMSYHQYKNTVKIKDIEDTVAELGTKDKVILCTGKYKNLGRIVEISNLVFKGDVTVLYVAQDIVHYFAPYTTLITDYLRTVNIKTGELMIGEHIRNLNTWRLVFELREQYSEYADNFELLKAFTSIDIKTLQNIYYESKITDPRTLIENTTGMKDNLLDDIFGYLKSLEDFQKVVKTANKDKIAAKALELFNSDEIYHIDAYDEGFISTIKEEFERLYPIKDLLVLLEYSGDFTSAKPLIDTLLTTLKLKQNDNI